MEINLRWYWGEVIVHKDLASCVLEQLNGYLHSLEQLHSMAELKKGVLLTFRELEETTRLGGRVIISYDSEYEYKARHFWEELLGQYKAKRGAVPSLLLLKGPASSWSGGVRERDFLVHFGSFSPSAPRSSVVWVADHSGEPRRAGGKADVDMALPHYGLLSFVLHAFCEAFEPSGTSFRLESAIESAVNATKATIESFNLSSVLMTLEGMLKAQVCKGGGFLFLAGNGGSACDTFDIGSDVPVLFLAESGYITCVANDFGYETVFSRAVESMEVGYDVFLGISTSGRSPNIVKALKAAKERKVEAIFLGGVKGGPATEVSDLNILVGSEETNRIQEIHSMVLRGVGNWIRQC